MPTLTRTTKDREEKFETLQDGARVYVSKSYRFGNKWVAEQKYPRCYLCTDDRDAKTFSKRLIDKLPKGFELVGGNARELEAYRNKQAAERDREDARWERAMQRWNAKHHAIVAELKKMGRVYWTGTTPSKQDEFWEITLRGNTVTVRTGKIGKGRARTEKLTLDKRADALAKAQRRMMNAMDVLRFGPAKHDGDGGAGQTRASKVR